MGLFDFFKPKKPKIKEVFEKISNQMFPKGEKDINAGADELMRILKNKINKDLAKNIFLKSMAISKIVENFDEERLRMHLGGYCLEYFTTDEVKFFHSYLMALNAAMRIHGKTPSEVTREGEIYYW
jgi:hypothetical protein